MRITTLLLGSLLVFGCGDASTGGTHPTGGTPTTHPDLALHPSSEDLAMPEQGGDTGDMAMADNSGADMGCKPPSSLHPPKPGMPAIYCPFSETNGGKAMYCQQGQQHCCEPAQGTAMCDPLATLCGPTDTDWQCEDPSDCGNGQQCCGSGTLVIAPQGCQNYASHFTGTHCAASCAQGQIVMCTSDAECGGGKTCIPFETKGNQVGGCM